MAESTYMRLALQDCVVTGHHAGLKLQHGLSQNDDKGKNAHRTNVAATVISPKPEHNAYKIAFDRFDRLMKQPGVIRLRAELTGPLAVGLGVASPTENGLALFHTYGAPTIPASSLKGAFRRAIEALGDKLSADQKSFLVGSDRGKSSEAESGRAGRLVFHDGWYEPSPIPDTPFHPDIMTPHHGGYYKNKGMADSADNAAGQYKAAPADFEDPVPVGFISVKRGTKFVFYIECPTTDSAWLEFVREALTHTLTEVGLGAKTNAGYGYFKVIG